MGVPAVARTDEAFASGFAGREINETRLVTDLFGNGMTAGDFISEGFRI